MTESQEGSSFKERLISFRNKHCLMYKSFKYAKAFCNTFGCCKKDDKQESDGERENNESKEER